MKIIGYATADGRFMSAEVFAAWSAREPEQAAQFKPVVFADHAGLILSELREIARDSKLPATAPISRGGNPRWSVGGEVEDWAKDLMKRIGE